MRPRFPGLALGALASLLFSSTAGAQWVPHGRPVSSSEGTHSRPTVVPDGSQGAYVVWQYGGPGPQEVLVSHVLADGSAGSGFLPLGSPVSGEAGSRFLRGAGPDGSGGLVVGWATTGTAWAKRMHSDGTPAAGWAAQGNARPPSVGVVEIGELVADGLGGAWIRFRVERSSCPHPPVCEYDSYQKAHHIDAGGAWNAAEYTIVYSNAQNGAEGGRIGLSSAGTAFMHSSLAGPIRRVSAPYQETWGSNSTALWGYWQYRVWSDGAGGAWLMEISNSPRVLRLGADGQLYPGWPSEFVAPTPETVSAVDAVETEPGSFLIGWTEFGAAGELRVQKLTGAGVPATGWPADGLVVCSAPGSRDALVMAPDGFGGALLVWRDSRDEPAGDLYAHHLLANGELDPAFAANGTAVAAVPGGVAEPSLSVVAPGEAVVAWTDQRTLSEIRAQRLAFLPLADVDSRGASRVSLAGFAPNPAVAAPRVAFTLSGASDASVELFDLTGRRVHAARFEGLAAGPHALVLAPARPLPPGLYLVRLRALGEERVRRGLVAR